MVESYKEKILTFLKNNKTLMNPRKLSKEMGISYPVALKYCDILFAEKKIEIRKIGNIKLVAINKVLRNAKN